MGYHIQYGKMTRIERLALRQLSKKTIAFKTGVALGVLAIAILLSQLGFCDFLIPGDKEVTKEAFYIMLNDVREGENVRVAIAAFCEDILDNADYEE